MFCFAIVNRCTMLQKGVVCLCLLLSCVSRSNAFFMPVPKLAPAGAISGGTSAAQATMSALPQALIFDCDGVLADTERDGHRPAFNSAFKSKSIDAEWGVELYGELLSVGGGKERMTAHWNAVGWPEPYTTSESQQALVKELHLLKTSLFNEAILKGEIPLRPGVLRLVDEAISNNVPLAVCSTSNDKAVTNLVKTLMGEDRLAQIKIFAGDVVEKKKPAPDIYNLAKDVLGLDPSLCIVIEDSHIGLTSAKAAGMNCLITRSSYTVNEDFAAADKVLDDLGEDPSNPSSVTLTSLGAIVEAAKAES